jgi:predicted nucleic acid-binding protein
VRFWDTSALVPLLLEQPATAQARELLSQDPGVVAWWGAAVECASSAARLRREERLSPAEEEQTLELLDILRASWLEILPSEEVRSGALRLLRVHSLKAADALQLAAARVWAGTAHRPELVTYDERLALAARLEGFRVLPRQRP